MLGFIGSGVFPVNTSSCSPEGIHLRCEDRNSELIYNLCGSVESFGAFEFLSQVISTWKTMGESREGNHDWDGTAAIAVGDADKVCLA
jgi:hypothetical protein